MLATENCTAGMKTKINVALQINGTAYVLPGGHVNVSSTCFGTGSDGFGKGVGRIV
jgi:hypothetical protein